MQRENGLSKHQLRTCGTVQKEKREGQNTGFAFMEEGLSKKRHTRNSAKRLFQHESPIKYVQGAVTPCTYSPLPCRACRRHGFSAVRAAAAPPTRKPSGMITGNRASRRIAGEWQLLRIEPLRRRDQESHFLCRPANPWQLPKRQIPLHIR